jgi:hypothetical protein
MSRERQEAGKGARGEISGGSEEQGAGMVEMLFLGLNISARHQSVDLLVPRPAVKGVEVLPVAAEGRGKRAERRAVESIILCKLTFLIGHKSHKFLGISMLIAQLTHIMTSNINKYKD